MNSVFLVSSAIYFPVQICLTCFLLFIDIRAYRILTGGFHGRVYRLEKTLLIIFNVLQIGLLIASLVGIAVTICFGRDMRNWIETGVVFSLQLGTGTSVSTMA